MFDATRKWLKGLRRKKILEERKVPAKKRRTFKRKLQYLPRTGSSHFRKQQDQGMEFAYMRKAQRAARVGGMAEKKRYEELLAAFVAKPKLPHNRIDYPGPFGFTNYPR